MLSMLAAMTGFTIAENVPALVKDINAQEIVSSSYPASMTRVGQTIFFIAADGIHGRELWKTDGTPGGTVMVKDVQPGAGSGLDNSVIFSVVGSKLFFTADDGVAGKELWVSDGSSGGTVMLKDIYPGATSSGLTMRGVLGGNLLFAATDGTAGRELWKSDGTAAGTVMIKDIFAGPEPSAPGPMTVLNGFAYFSAISGNGQELWRTNGTNAGTTLVKDIYPGAASSQPEYFAVLGNKLLFAAAGTMEGSKDLWISDGTSAGTTLLKDVDPTDIYGNPIYLTTVGGVVYFSAYQASTGRELWKSDGTTAGTVLVKDIVPGSGSGVGHIFIGGGSHLYFSATTAEHGTELWRSDGTAAGTWLLKDIMPGTGMGLSNFYGANFKWFGGYLYFQADDGISGNELWRSDGTTIGTVMFKDISPDSSSSPLHLEVNDTRLFFSAQGPLLSGKELWSSDGTVAGTTLLKDIARGTASSFPLQFTQAGQLAYFSANDGSTGRELWKSDGHTASLVKDIRPGSGAGVGNQLGMGVLNGIGFFRADDGVAGLELWKTDGTEAGTVLLKDLVPGSGSGNPQNIISTGNRIYFEASVPPYGTELWVSDGTGAGTVMLKDISPGEGNSFPTGFSPRGDILYFAASSQPAGYYESRDLWKTDGTETGTSMIHSFSDFGLKVQNVAAAGSTLYIHATSWNGHELWKSDGTGPGTVLVKAFPTGGNLAVGSIFVPVGNLMFFTVSDGTYGNELWRSDGTAAGTFMVKDIFVGSSSGVLSLYGSSLAVGNILYFRAEEESNGGHLWKSDGTAAGTLPVKPGAGAWHPSSITSVGNILYFRASGPNGDVELWRSDGTAVGTRMVADLAEGPSYPEGWAFCNNQLLFSATTPATGYELFGLSFNLSLRAEYPAGNPINQLSTLKILPESSIQVTLVNTGAAPVTALVPTLSGSHPADFTVSGMPSSLAAGASGTFTIYYHPSGYDPSSARISITASDSSLAPFQLDLGELEHPPVIRQQPQPQTILEDAQATLSVDARGTAPLQYQWYQGNSGNTSQPISGAIGSSFQTPALLSTTNFWVRVANGHGHVDSGTVTVTVTPRIPVFTSPTTAGAAAGTLFTFAPAATFGPHVFSSPDLPGWLTINQSSGLLAGTPPDGGSWTVHLQAANARHTGTGTLTITATPPPPVVTSAGAHSGRQGQSVSYQITATRSPGSYGATGLPGNLVVNSTNGLISGVPTSYGTFHVTVSASNGGGIGSRVVVFEIEPPIPLPVITSPLFAAGGAGTPFAYSLAGSPEVTSFAISSAPAWLSLSGATVSGTPPAPGAFSFQARAVNTSGPGAWRTIELNVAPHPLAPVITSQGEARGRKGDAFNFTLTASPAATSYAVSGALPPGVVRSGAVLSGTPTAEGSYLLTVTGTNASGQSAPRSLSIIIGPARQVPVITGPASFTASIGSPFTGTIAATNSPTSFEFTGLPEGITQVGQSGQITGTPATPGNFSFSVRATNSDGPGHAQPVALRVAYHPNAPVISPPPVDMTAYVGVPFLRTISITPAAQSIQATGLPSGLTITAAGAIGGTPTTEGTFEITAQATNSSGIGAAVVFRIIVKASPGTPVISGSLAEEAKALVSFTYQIQTQSNPLPVTGYSATGLPPGLLLNQATGAISGTPTVLGTFPVELRVSNAAGNGNPAILSIIVRAGPDRPKITSSSAAAVRQDDLFNYQITASPGPVTAWLAEPLPAGLLLNAETGVISGRTSVPGIHKVSLRASNANGQGNPLELQIQVNPKPAVPVIPGPVDIAYDYRTPVSVQLMATNMPPKPWASGIGFFAEDIPSGLTLTSDGLLSGTSSTSDYFTVYAVNESGRGEAIFVYMGQYTYPETSAFLIGPKSLAASSGKDLSFRIQHTGVAHRFHLYLPGVDAFRVHYDQDTPAFTISAAHLPLPGKSFYGIGFDESNGGWLLISGLSMSVSPKAGAPQIQSSYLFATAGASLDVPIVSTGNPTRYEVTAMSPAWPSGLQFNATTGRFHGTVSQPQTISFLVRGYNGVGPGLAKEVTMNLAATASGDPLDFPGQGIVGIQLHPGSPQLITLPLDPNVQPRSLASRSSGSDEPVTARAGEWFTYQIQSHGFASRYRIPALPDGLAYNENTGEISGQPSKPGFYGIRVTPIGENATGLERVLPLRIFPATGAPMITSPDAASTTAGAPFVWTFAASGNAAGFNLSGLPSWMRFDPFTGILSGTPYEPVPVTFTVSAFNASGESDPQTFTILVSAAAGTPVMNAVGSGFEGRVGDAFSATISAGGAAFYDSTSLPFGIALDRETGVMSGTPVEAGVFEAEVWAVNTSGRGVSMKVTFRFSGAVGTPSLTNPRVVHTVRGRPFSLQLASTPVATSYQASDLPEGIVLDSASGLLSGSPATGSWSFPVWGAGAAGQGTPVEIQLNVHENTAALWRAEKFEGDMHDPDVSGWTADPDRDGLKNLLEYAFNLPPKQSGAPVSAPASGTSGLPSIRTIGTQPVLRLEYIRLKAAANPGITYQPQISSTLGDTGPGAWEPLVGNETVHSIDDMWERVIIEQAVSTGPRHFARVRVSGP